MVSLIGLPPEKIREAFVNWAYEADIFFRLLAEDAHAKAPKGLEALFDEAAGVVNGYSHIIKNISKY